MTDSSNSHNFPVTAGIRIVATYKHEQRTHNDGYCSDPGEYTEEEEMKVIDFLVPPPCHEFLDQYMDDSNFVGSIDDLKNFARYVYDFCSQFTRRQFRDLGFDRNYRYFCKTIMDLNQTHAPSGCNGYCDGYSFKRLISVEIVNE